MRYIAIDNVCAWPNLTKMPDGTVVAAIFNQPCHGLWEGDVECWGSEDGGHTWRLRGTPAPHEPGTTRMNVAAGLAANGDLIVLASGWTHRPRRGEGQAGHGPPARTLRPWVCRSSDGGRTWSRSETFTLPQDIESVIPFGDIIQLADGGLGAACYAQGSTFFYASTDDGLTWQVRGVLQRDNINETALLALPDGGILACARTVDDQHLELFRSTDHGKNWQREQALSQAKQHPAHLLNLIDGRVLATYGDRRDGHHGIEGRFSSDAGRTWSEPHRLVELEPADLGYPATVQHNDGTLLTAWYASGVTAHQRYHMGVGLWSPDDRLQ